jgi:succinate-semialdehyde dehydrogenase/glutarate-semialdehyde dehydrogenase
MKYPTYTPPSLFIAGEWIAETGASTPVVNPASGEEIGRAPSATPALIERALAAAEAGFALWRAVPLEKRAAIMTRAAAELRTMLPRGYLPSGDGDGQALCRGEVGVGKHVAMLLNGRPVPPPNW